MERVTQNNAAEQTAAAAGELTAQAGFIKGIVDQLAALSNAT